MSHIPYEKNTNALIAKGGCFVFDIYSKLHHKQSLLNQSAL